MRYGGRGPSWLPWVRACESWPAPWVAVEQPGALWWLARVLAYRDMRYAIEHERDIPDEGGWDEKDGW